MRVRSAVDVARWIALGIAAGGLAGLASFVFLEALEWATNTRLAHPGMLWLLPVAGLGVGAAYHYLGGRSSGGNSLLIEEIHSPRAWLPRRMAPLVLAGTVVSHLFGASVGREGTAIQMSGSLNDGLARLLRLNRRDRRTLLIAAIAGGFGSVFGVPIAGAVFGLEVPTAGRVHHDALVPALAASITGNLVVRGLGHHYAVHQAVVVDLSVTLLLKVAVAAVAFGLVGALFVEATERIRGWMTRVPWPPLRTAIGGVATIGLAVVFGRDYLGLSLPLIDDALAGHHVSPASAALKVLFTVVALGCGFPGGEVTPLFVIGATLGAAVAVPLGLPPGLLAAVGFVAVFAGATNTPLACTIMGVELFGRAALVPLAVGCVLAFVFSTHRSIYASQRRPGGRDEPDDDTTIQLTRG